MTPEDESNFRVLSLDGGGVRGYLSALLLANMESFLDNYLGDSSPIGKRFDLIVGTSTGGLIALALAAGKRAAEVLSFYETHIPLIFGSTKRRSIGWFTSPKYKPSDLSKALDDFFGDATMGDLARDACVVAVSLQNAKPRLYKSAYLKRNAGRLGELLVDVALSTSAAPTYFPAHSGRFSSDLVDGGLCANNPAVVGIVEALQFEEKSKRTACGAVPPDLERIRLVSIGTGEPCAMPYDHRKLKQAGLRQWIFSVGRSGPAVPLFEVTIEAQSVLAHFQAAFMLKERYLRVNPRLTFPMRLDDASRISELKNLGDLDKPTEVWLKQCFRSAS